MAVEEIRSGRGALLALSPVAGERRSFLLENHGRKLLLFEVVK